MSKDEKKTLYIIICLDFVYSIFFGMKVFITYVRDRGLKTTKIEFL